jgi:predicted DNA-binding transcriptional regulator YafY
MPQKKSQKVKKTSAQTKKNLPEARNRNAIWRIHQIDALVRAGKRPNGPYLTKKLQTSRSSIARDIEFMRDRLLLPLEIDPVRGGYYYTKEAPPLPHMQFSEGDLFGFCVLEQMMTLFRGTQLEAQLRGTFEKLATGLQDEISVSWEALAEAVSFRTTTTPNRVEPEILETISRVVSTHEEVEFLYSSLQSDKAEWRRVEPFHIRLRDGVSYLFAYDPAREETRCFMLLRMQQLRTTGRFFEKAERHSDPDTKLQHSIGVFGGEKPELVRLRLSKMGARLFSERSYHPTQKITQTSDGGSELTMTVYINPELEQMLMSHFREAKVIEPESLRLQLLENARQMLTWANEPV